MRCGGRISAANVQHADIPLTIPPSSANTVVKGDFMKLREQFGEGSFDAVYAIEATVHAPTWEGVYGEIKRVLKPGGVVRIGIVQP